MIKTRYRFSLRFDFFVRVRKAVKESLREAGKKLVAAARSLIGRKSRRASMPGEYPISKTGNYRRSIAWEYTRSGQYIRVGASWPRGAHAPLLKYGTKKMAARLVPAEGALEKMLGELPRGFSGILK